MRIGVLVLAGCGAAAPPAAPRSPPRMTSALPASSYTVAPAQSTSAPPRRPAPAVRQLAAAADVTCTVHSDHSVRCWGDDAFHIVTPTMRGEIADHAVRSPTRVVDVPAATHLVLGADHACVLADDARVWCWGTDDGALGIGNGLPPGPPPLAKPSPVLGLTGVDALAGRTHLCARVAGGAVSCWHDYDAGVGDPRDAGSTKPVLVPGFAGAKQLADGGNLSCALLATGTSRCFRDVSPGRIPRGKVRLDPTDVPGLGAVTAIVAGSDGVCGLTAARTVRCWGQTPLPHPGGASVHAPAYAVAGLTDVTQLALGDDVACALVTGGAVLCAQNDQPFARIAIEPAVEIAAGAAHACARTSAGGVVCWGRNDQGQLGGGDTSPHDHPVTVSF